jgi:hypothetical protein
MSSPPKKAPGAGKQTGRKLILKTYYDALSILANVSGAVFWFVEQRRWRLADLIDDEDLQS